MVNIKNKAFTLIELLVVVAIISLLSSVVIVSLQDSREKAAIAKLKEQTRQIQTALELYRSDYGEYPPNDAGNSISISTLISSLDDYIEYFTYDTSQIRSYATDGIYYYNNNESTVLSCGNFSHPQYIIYFAITTLGASTDDFLEMNYNDVGLGLYCLNTPI